MAKALKVSANKAKGITVISRHRLGCCVAQQLMASIIS
ncbi:hypothetical protein AALB_3367 [Agarivorans albus MKT 106]|uniref:Uncharacterized protein n=1 Tax=Agarivorans albus MKT 106 TaxID=1331007 RepID=R9PPI5_AGAAL|nr:hypothetical protein AALB_3367 [Agarivorans albus MKT 106]